MEAAQKPATILKDKEYLENTGHFLYVTTMGWEVKLEAT